MPNIIIIFKYKTLIVKRVCFGTFTTLLNITQYITHQQCILVPFILISLNYCFEFVSAYSTLGISKINWKNTKHALYTCTCHKDLFLSMLYSFPFKCSANHVWYYNLWIRTIREHDLILNTFQTNVLVYNLN